MIAKDLISDIIIPLKTSDTAAKALSWMEVFRISHLPIVNNREFLGMISDTDIYDLNETNTAIGAHELSLYNAFVYDYQHIFDVINSISQNKLTIIPVVNASNEYLGVIVLNDLVQKFIELTSIDKKGSIIVLEVNNIDYHLTEISRIIENNDAKILSLYVKSLANSNKIDVTLKLNILELTSIIQTFERYNYTIKSSFSDDNHEVEIFEERLDSLINYLNI